MKDEVEEEEDVSTESLRVWFFICGSAPSRCRGRLLVRFLLCRLPMVARVDKYDGIDDALQRETGTGWRTAASAKAKTPDGTESRKPKQHRRLALYGTVAVPMVPHHVVKGPGLVRRLLQ